MERISRSLNTTDISLVTLFNVISILGNIIFSTLLVILIDNENKKTGIKAIVGVILLFVLLKFLVEKKRPYEDDTDISNEDFIGVINGRSFPSLHMGGITILSLVLWEVYGSYIFYIVFPVLVGLSRIGLGVHDLMDCVSGFLLATFLYIFIRMVHKHKC